MNVRARLSPERRESYDAVMRSLRGPIRPCTVRGHQVQVRRAFTDQQERQAAQWIALNGYQRLDVLPPDGKGNAVIEVTGAGPDGPVTEQFVVTLADGD